MATDSATPVEEPAAAHGGSLAAVVVGLMLVMLMAALGIPTPHARIVEGEGGHADVNLLDGNRTERWRKALTAVDRMRDKFGESSVSMGTGMKARFRERVHENPASLPGKEPK